jgi:hypothetical protein
MTEFIHVAALALALSASAFVYAEIASLPAIGDASTAPPF